MPSKLFRRFLSSSVFAVLFFISKNSRAATFSGQVVDESKVVVAQVQVAGFPHCKKAWSPMLTVIS